MLNTLGRRKICFVLLCFLRGFPDMVVWEDHVRIWLCRSGRLMSIDSFACSLVWEISRPLHAAQRMLSSYWDGCQTDSKVHSETWILVWQCAVLQNFAAGIFHVQNKFDKNGYCGRSWLWNYYILAHLLNGSMLGNLFRSMCGFGRENKIQTIVGYLQNDLVLLSWT